MIDREEQERAGVCTDCGIRGRSRGKLCDRCHSHRKAEREARRQRLKKEVFQAYGGALCVCCGEANEAFLTIDHMNGDGAWQRRMDPSSIDIYSWAKRNGFPPVLQVLCFNCNFAKHVYGQCPHEQK